MKWGRARRRCQAGPDEGTAVMTGTQDNGTEQADGRAGGPAGAGLDAAITGVTVFTDGARVTRSGVTPVPGGTHAVLIASLPETTDPSSVRVTARGHDLALLNVEVQRRVSVEPAHVSFARLRDDVERCRDTVRELDDADSAEQAGLGFLGHLSEAAATSLSRAVGAGRAGYAELSAMAGHLSGSTAAVLGRRREIAVRKRAAQRELDAALARLQTAEAGPGDPVVTVAVIATLDAAADTEAEVEVVYHVKGATWHPLYDLALQGERLNVSYLAEVKQRTGEDWPEVPLVLSTTRRGLRESLPELKPWYIGRPAPPTAVPMMAGAAAPPAPAPRPGPPSGGARLRAAAFAGAPEAAQPAASAGRDESGAGLTYTVARPLAVPGDNSPHKTLVARFDADARLDYLTVPALSAEAYLRATVTNGPLLLLPGQARIFHGAQFAGETRLDSTAPGEEFEVQLGVDDEVKVERKLLRRTTSKAVLGSTRTIDIAYEITVENHRDRKAVVSVHDHIPVSTDGDIKVRPRETSPAPVTTDDLGELTWTLTLTPGASAAVRHRFTVEHPAAVSVSGL
jgi:uncharacterized protein (TIGR02231 family)